MNVSTECVHLLYLQQAAKKRTHELEVHISTSQPIDSLAR